MNSGRARANTLVQQAEIVYAIPGMEEATEGDVVYTSNADAVAAAASGAGAHDDATYANPGAVSSSALYAVPDKVRVAFAVNVCGFLCETDLLAVFCLRVSDGGG